MRKLITLCGLFAAITATAQTSPYVKFGKVTPEELQKKIYPIDSNANAVVLSDIGEASVEGNSKGWFSLVFERHRVVHILNKAGYDEADVEIPLYVDGTEEEKLDNVKAVTYNLENGKIVETKLDKSGIFKEKRSSNWVVKKFTMPAVKEGCIIEFDYKVISDFISVIDPWHFQGGSPVLWSEYKFSVPSFFTYAFLGHGYHPMTINETPKTRQVNFTVIDTRTAGASDRASFPAAVTDYRWVMTDVPEIKQESFTSALKNHISGIEFQLTSKNYPLTPEDYRSTWGGLIKGLRESEYFGAHLNRDNNWLGEELKPIISSAGNDLEKAKKIYSYLQDNFTCTDHSALSMGQTIKNVFKAKKGNIAEINLLLTAMLRYAGLKADPVILSTTDHGYVMETSPMITSFNYVVSKITLSGQDYYLDASHTNLGFGKLLPECYNGHARVVDEVATPLSFSADSIREKKVTAVFITNSEKGEWIGSVNQTPGYFESYKLREKIKEKGEETLFKDIAKEYNMDVKLSQTRIDSLKNSEEPIALHYDLDFNLNKENLLYVNPLFGEAYKENPFKSAERYYPVEMPYTMDETYLVTMEIPKGYEVDELPKQVVAKMDEAESAYFEYRISQSGSTISLRSRMKINRTLFMPDEYQTLRDFFSLIVKKQNEQIVFKKKK